MDPDRRTEIRAEMLLAMVAVIWAANYPIAKYAISRLDIFVFNGIRFTIAAALISVIFLKREQWQPVHGSDWPKLLRAGVVANIVYQVAFIVGLSMTTAGNSAVLLATAPLWTVLINARVQKERIAAQMWQGMAVSLVGIVMIIVGSGKKVEFGGSALYGDVICLAAAFLWAANTNLQRPLLSRYSPIQLTVVMLLIGAVGLTALAVPPAMSMDWSSLPWTYYLAAVVSGGFSIGIANLLWTQGVKRLGPGRTANFGNLVPVLAFVLSYFTLKEELSLIQVVGAAVTVAGVWYARR